MITSLSTICFIFIVFCSFGFDLFDLDWFVLVTKLLFHCQSRYWGLKLHFKMNLNNIYLFHNAIQVHHLGSQKIY